MCDGFWRTTGVGEGASMIPGRSVPPFCFFSLFKDDLPTTPKKIRARGLERERQEMSNDQGKRDPQGGYGSHQRVQVE